MMYPPVYSILSAAAPVTAYVSTRIYPHGAAPQDVAAPYITWLVQGGAPENSLSDLPPIDSYVTVVRVWTDNDGSGGATAYPIAQAVRDAIEPYAHMEDVPTVTQDAETNRYSVTMTFRFWVDRD